MVNENFTEEQARSYLKEMLPKLDYWKRYDELSDNGQFEEFKKQLINEINELSRKQRSVGLTPEEKERQAELRQAYLVGFRENMKNVLDRIEIVDKVD